MNSSKSLRRIGAGLIVTLLVTFGMTDLALSKGKGKKERGIYSPIIQVEPKGGIHPRHQGFQRCLGRGEQSRQASCPKTSSRRDDRYYRANARKKTRAFNDSVEIGQWRVQMQPL